MKENKIFGKRFCLFMMIAYLMTLLVPGEVIATSGGTISTVAGNGTAGSSGDGGAAWMAQLNYPYGVAVDSGGNLYIADTLNHRVRKVDASGNINTVAGNGTAGSSGDGGAAASAQLNKPFGVAVDSGGNLYIADTLNHRVRKVDTSGNISTVAGNGTAGSSGDGGAAASAQLNKPYGVAVDSGGNLYIADTFNHRIRKVDASGNISTVAGTGTAGNPGEGEFATSANIKYPYGVAVDSGGNLFYVADDGSSRVRKVDASGKISTVAGNGTAGSSGDGGAAALAQLYLPYGVAVDSGGNLYIADTYNQRVRKVDASGNISTVAGNGTAGSSGDGGAAALAQLNFPFGVAVDSGGILYIADTNNNRVRKVAAEPVPASGLTVTASDVTGEGTDGETKISVAETVGTGHKFVYKNFEGAAVSVPNVGDTLSGYTDLPADGIIAAANDDKIAVAEVDGSGKVVKFGQTTAVVEANPASPPTLTADSTNNYTTFAIEITFIDDAAWRSAITAVKDGSKTLNTTDYSITAGKITINAGVLSAGFHTVTVVATGYADAVVTQNVNLQDRPANPQNLTATAGNRLVNLNWNTVTGATYYNVYMSEKPNAYGETALATVTGATYQVQNLTNGMTYYFVVKAGNPGGLSAESNEVHATPATVPAAPTNVVATAGNGSATVTFTAPDDNGGSAITGYEVFDSNGNKVATGSADATSITITGLTNGTTYTFTVKAKNATGSSDPSTPSNAVTPRAPSNNHHDDDEETGSPSQPASPVPQPANVGVDVLVNGKTENTGTLATAEVNGQRVTTVAVDEEKLQQRLAAEGAGAVVTIPVTLDSDVVVGELNGRMIKNMENLQAVVELRTEKATYTLPAERINIDAIAERFGQNLALQDIKVKIEIAQPDTDIVRIVENAANREGFALVVPPLDFKVTAVYGDQTEEVARFSAYVERTIAIPEGIDPQRITTGVVIEPDGSTRHVPTKVIQIDGKYYAKINSLTNSTYSVVWHPLEFDDVANHWAKDAVNDMGSRMVIEGIGNGLFDPGRDITRAEFAAIIVRALGLKLQSGTSFFSDVKESDWYSSAVRTAYAYHLVGGFEDGTFRPNDMITREQAMVILSKAMTITNLKARLPVQTADVTLHTFGDAAEVSAWAQSSVADSVQAGIVSGRSGTALDPKDYMTRAEVATIIQRLLQKSGLI
ncbi:S-layer homology domain-containing protein [Paenibacillus lactis]|uniref:NHL domain-containing protein n=1 Tax=Paenibacillus lactis TaxID=228574 RepID=UPI00203EDDA8|nr:S-layer homology domain-containing protein [Paenibacillus lactis]MCM3494635.1 S-layer homology domain-containing protein [Paenibacillus lactis]